MGFQRATIQVSIALFLLFLSLPALSEGLVVGKAGGGVVFDSGLVEVGRFELNSPASPKLAVHPAAPILASLTPGDGLVFWNLPQVSEASRHESPLFDEGILSIQFSADGGKLYALSENLRAVVVFDLDSSKVTGALPIPGGEPRAMQVTGGGILIEQESAVSILSPIPEKGLLAQFRFPGEVLSGTLLGERVYLTLRGINGVWAYQFPSGRTLGLLPTQSEVGEVLERAGGLVLATMSGLESQSTTGGQAWALPSAGGGTFDEVTIAIDKKKVFTLDKASGVVLAVDAVSGAELSRTTLLGAEAVVAY